ncbi:MAG: hypothetical protein OEM05_11480, partial [Myxococcales bacterium]|nr:hypothetical protein [Myxococcales bacterium]
RAAILCHSVNNVVAVAVMAWAPAESPPAPLAVAVGLPLACGCLWAVWRRAGGPPAPGGLQQPAGSVDPWGDPGP